MVLHSDETVGLDVVYALTPSWNCTVSRRVVYDLVSTRNSHELVATLKRWIHFVADDNSPKEMLHSVAIKKSSRCYKMLSLAETLEKNFDMQISK